MPDLYRDAVGKRKQGRRLACAPSRRAEHQVRDPVLRSEVVTHRDRGALTPIVERPVVVADARIGPTRLGVAEEEKSMHSGRLPCPRRI